MYRVVLDTNVLISAILFRGKPGELLDAALRGNIHICISESIIEELTGVLKRRKFIFDSDIVHGLIAEVIAISERIEPVQSILAISEDPEDNRILECAVAGRADFIITGDRHLLHLQEFGDIKIVNPDQFLELL
jgi:uncharacterized protein